MQTEDQAQADFTRSMAFNTEAIRSGMFAAALDMADTLKQADIPNAEAILLTASIETAAQLWAQVSKQSGIPRPKARATLEKELRFFFNKHWSADQQPAATPQ